MLPMPLTDDRALDRRLGELLGYRQSHNGIGWVLVDSAFEQIGPSYDNPDYIWQEMPPFTADTDEGWAAMKLVYERMLQADPNGDMVTNGPFFGRYTARWRRHDDNGLWGDEATADSLPAAVALAAIAALEGHDATTYGSCLQRVGDDPR